MTCTNLRCLPLLAVLALAASACTGPTAGPYLDGGSIGAFPIGHTSFVTTTPEGRPIAVGLYYPADARRITPQSPEAVYPMDPFTAQVPPTPSSAWEARGYDRAYEAPAAAKGPFPLVVFSTGGTVYGDAYLYLGTRLASHGYVVAVVDHVNEIQWVATGWDGVLSLSYNRPRDLSFVLTELLTRNTTAGGPLRGVIDPKRVVAAGHSWGGSDALTLLAGDDEICDAGYALSEGPTPEEIATMCRATPADPRFTAAFSLEGSGDTLRYAELARIQAPSLVMGQANWADAPMDPAYPELLTTIARPHAAMAPTGRSVRVDLAMGDSRTPVIFPNHMAFSNACEGIEVLNAQGALSADDYATYASWWCGSELPIREVHRKITKYVVAFLDAQVRASAVDAASRILTQADATAGEAGVEVYWDECCTGGPACGADTATAFSYRKDPEPAVCLVGEKDPAAYFP